VRHALSIVLVAAGCGSEEIELAPAADRPRIELPGPTSDPGVCDPSTRRTCRPLDDACALDVECCTGRCEAGRCLPPGTCSAAGAACGSPSACCSDRCEPVVGSTNRACAPVCRALGAACTRAQECCSGGCSGGVCAPTICALVGDACVAAADCCSGVCQDARCRIDGAALCRPSGEDCTSGGGSPCCFACVGGRCDPGPGACRPLTAPCGADTDCCSGSCAALPGGTRACAGACGAEGAACRAPSDCCSGTCSASPGTCVPASSTCGSVGAACASNDACCSGLCLAGRCAERCASPVR
jgi:hypothetical protein